MIQVKENLCEVNKIVISPQNKPFVFKDIYFPDSLVDGEIYTFSSKINQSDNGSGRCGLTVKNNVTDINYTMTSLPIENYVYKFKYDKEKYSHTRIIIYPDVQEKTHNIGAEFYNISIVKGDGMDIYVPNKNGVKPENQALMPPEGNYKEIQAL